jgi:hypothetical protein
MFILQVKMNRAFSRIRKFIGARNTSAIALLIFVTCLFIYLSNDRTITSNDNIPSSLLAFNWLENHTLDLDGFRNTDYFGTNCSRCLGNAPYFFAEAPNGHLTSTYPIGVSIVTFPLYFVFYLSIKSWSFLQTMMTGVPHPFPNLTTSDFDSQRLYFEKLAAAISTALAVSIFYLSTRLKFSQATALLSTFIYAFATSTWVSSAQGLRQHTISNLVLTSLIFCVLKVNALEGDRRRTLLIVTGILCGLLPGVRVSSCLFSIATILYIVVTYRKESIFLGIGFSSLLLNAFWNFHYFGFGFSRFLVGGYSRLTNQGSFFSEYYDFTVEKLAEGLVFLLFNPNFGLLMFSPILLFGVLAIGQVFQRRVHRDEQFTLHLTFAAFALVIQYCFFATWTGGNGSYGPRYMTDVLPVAAYLTTYATAHWFEAPTHTTQKKRILRSSVCGGFLTCLVVATSIQAIGAFGRTSWGTIPIPLNLERTWDWQDTQVRRHWNNLYFKWVPPIKDKQKYREAFNGQIQKITDQRQQLLPASLVVRSARQMILKANLINIGRVQWYGYQTGMQRGSAIVRARFLSEAGEEIETASKGRLYVSGMPKAGESTTAVGAIAFPKEPGTYQLVFDLAIQGLYKGLQDSAIEAEPARYRVQVRKAQSSTKNLPKTEPVGSRAGQLPRSPQRLPARRSAPPIAARCPHAPAPAPPPAAATPQSAPATLAAKSPAPSALAATNAGEPACTGR